MGKQSKVKKPTDSAESEKKETSPPKPKEKPYLPSVSELLVTGGRDENDPPETFFQALIMPALLLLTFGVSLWLFTIAPIETVRISIT
jgi:hypothetical protein